MIARFILHHERRHSCERPLVPGLKVRGGGRGCWAAALGGRISAGGGGSGRGVEQPEAALRSLVRRALAAEGMASSGEVSGARMRRA